MGVHPLDGNQGGTDPEYGRLRKKPKAAHEEVLFSYDAFKELIRKFEDALVSRGKDA